MIIILTKGIQTTTALLFFFFFQAEDGIRGFHVTGVRRVLFRSSSSTRANRAGCSSPGSGWTWWRSTSRCGKGGSSPGSTRRSSPARRDSSAPTRGASRTWSYIRSVPASTSRSCRGDLSRGRGPGPGPGPELRPRPRAVEVKVEVKVDVESRRPHPRPPHVHVRVSVPAPTARPSVRGTREALHVEWRPARRHARPPARRTVARHPPARPPAAPRCPRGAPADPAAAIARRVDRGGRRGGGGRRLLRRRDPHRLGAAPRLWPRAHRPPRGAPVPLPARAAAGRTEEH